MDKQSIKTLQVSCVGCSLVDSIYANVDFNSEAFRHYLSESDGDGGLNPGHLVFVEDLEHFSGKPFMQIRNEISNGANPDAFNLGGPAIVALINAAQITQNQDIQFNFYGVAGRDDTAQQIFDILRCTPVNIDNYIQLDGTTPFTDVFSDPSYHNGNGERTFVNDIAVACQYTPEHIDQSFFDADIIFFGGTALTPGIHDHLTSLLKKSKAHDCVNIVTTVFDFRNEKRYAGKRWPLGESDESYSLIDLLIVDWVEALRLSGTDNIDDAIKFFIDSGTHSLIITHGSENFYIWSDNTFFKQQEITVLPVCNLADKRLAAHPELKGDTTGCGDNFAGGVLASVSQQLRDKKKGKLDLLEACSWGCASGGFACFYMGGTYLEKFNGEKREKIAEFQQAYMQQIAVKK